MIPQRENLPVVSFCLLLFTFSFGTYRAVPPPVHIFYGCQVMQNGYLGNYHHSERGNFKGGMMPQGFTFIHRLDLCLHTPSVCTLFPVHPPLLLYFCFRYHIYWTLPMYCWLYVAYRASLGSAYHYQVTSEHAGTKVMGCTE